jgi:rod shape-determining protein MreC
MFTLRRWWDRYGVRLGLVGLALGTAWLLRATQGGVIFELYQQLSRPLQPSGPTPEELLENAQTQALQQRVQELEQQNRQLQDLLGYVQSRPEAAIVAPVIGRSADHWWQHLLLGRGSQDGIEVGDIASGAGGLVGRVIQVTRNTSRILLISDPTSQIGVTISRSRSMGYMRGQSQDRAVMEFFEKVPDVRPGDTVTTSMFSQLFPEGLPIGQVVSVDMSNSPAPTAIIDLAVPVSHLEWLVVSDNPKAVTWPEVETPPSNSIPGVERGTP